MKLISTLNLVKSEQEMLITAHDLYDQAGNGLFISGVVNQIEQTFEVLNDASYVFTEKKKITNCAL